jgi:transposase
MSHEWLEDARKIPDEVMSYLRKIAVRTIVQEGYSPELVPAIFGISCTAIYDWLRRFRKDGYDGLETRQSPGAPPVITALERAPQAPFQRLYKTKASGLRGRPVLP